MISFTVPIAGLSRRGGEELSQTAPAVKHGRLYHLSLSVFRSSLHESISSSASDWRSDRPVRRSQLRLGRARPSPRRSSPSKVSPNTGSTTACASFCFPIRRRRAVTVNLTVLVGSRHEGYGETGMAHLLEHMVFKGTPQHPDVPKALRDHGAQFNGTTWVDRTNYFETMPATDENLKFALALEADRLVNSYVKREDLASEMTVVRNEFEMRREQPDAHPHPAHDGGRLRMAQLRQIDHRQPLRHRACADRQPAGLLPEVLSAR